MPDKRGYAGTISNPCLDNAQAGRAGEVFFPDTGKARFTEHRGHIGRVMDPSDCGIEYFKQDQKRIGAHEPGRRFVSHMIKDYDHAVPR